MTDETAIEKLIRVTALLKGDSTMRLRADARAELTTLQKERAAMIEALDWIEAEPEDPAKVQMWARAALDAARRSGSHD